MGKSRQDFVKKSERKFDKKVQFYSKVRDTVAKLYAQKSISKKKKLRSRQKKLKAYDLTSLSDLLPELNASKQPNIEADFKFNCKSRQKLLLNERKQMNVVLNHPAFQSDPFEAIHQHLQSTQPVLEEKPKKKANKNGSKKAKEKRLRGSIRPMDM